MGLWFQTGRLQWPHLGICLKNSPPFLVWQCFSGRSRFSLGEKSCQKKAHRLNCNTGLKNNTVFTRPGMAILQAGGDPAFSTTYLMLFLGRKISHWWMCTMLSLESRGGILTAPGMRRRTYSVPERMWWKAPLILLLKVLLPPWTTNLSHPNWAWYILHLFYLSFSPSIPWTN